MYIISTSCLWLATHLQYNKFATPLQFPGGPLEGTTARRF